MQKIERKKGSALLLALMMMMVMLPLAVGVVSLGVASGKITVTSEDSQIAKMASESGVNDVRARIGAYESSNSGSVEGFMNPPNDKYWVEINDNSKHNGAIDLSEIKPNLKYYEVVRTSGSSNYIFTVTGYYAGIKTIENFTVDLPGAPPPPAGVWEGSIIQGDGDLYYLDSGADILYSGGGYSTDGKEGFNIYNLADLNNPKHIGSLAVTMYGQNSVQMVVASNKHAYIALNANNNDGTRINVVDVADPDNPQPDGYFSVPCTGIDCGGTPSPFGLAADGRYLYVHGKYRSDSDYYNKGYHELIIYDLQANPHAPTRVGRITLGGIGELNGAGRGSVYIKDIAGTKYAFVATGKRGIAIVNVNDPALPSLVSLTSFPASLNDPSSTDVLSLSSVIYFEGFLYMTFGQGLAVMRAQDLAIDPQPVVVRGPHNICNWPNTFMEIHAGNMALDANHKKLYAYTGYLYNAGMMVYDISDGNNVQMYSGENECHPFIEGRGGSSPLYDEDGDEYLVTQGWASNPWYNTGWSIWDLHEGANFLTRFGHSPIIGTITDMKRAYDGTIFLATGLGIRSISQYPEKVVHDGPYIDAESPWGPAAMKIATHETAKRLYFIRGSSSSPKLQVYNTSNLDSVTLTKEITIPITNTGPTEMLIQGDYLYASFYGDVWKGVVIINVGTDPDNPTITKILNMPFTSFFYETYKQKMAIYGDNLYIVNAGGGTYSPSTDPENRLFVVDISDKFNPVLANTYAVKRPVAIDVDADYIYIGTGADKEKMIIVPRDNPDSNGDGSLDPVWIKRNGNEAVKAIKAVGGWIYHGDQLNLYYLKKSAIGTYSGSGTISGQNDYWWKPYEIAGDAASNIIIDGNQAVISHSHSFQFVRLF